MSLLSVGQKFPRFDKTSVVSMEKGKEFTQLTNDLHEKDGKWMVIDTTFDVAYASANKMTAMSKIATDYKKTSDWGNQNPLV